MSRIKTCVRCEEDKDSSEFHKNKRAADGLAYACKTCRNSSDRSYRSSEKGTTKRKNWVKDNPKSVMLYGAKKRAKKDGIPFDLSIDDFDIPDVCPILGIRLLKNSQPGPLPSSPSLDKIIPALGYVKGNVQVVSNRANAMKSDATLEELRAFADWVYREVPDV